MRKVGGGFLYRKIFPLLLSSWGTGSELLYWKTLSLNQSYGIIFLSSGIMQTLGEEKKLHTLAQHCYTAAAKSLQSCPTLCDPIDGSPWGSSVPGILQARTLEWVAIAFSNAWKWKVKVKSLSRVWLLANPWTEAHQAPPSMGFSRQECWSGVPLPSPAQHKFME